MLCSTFFKYKPCYITPPTEREKESWVCIECQNAHLLLTEINTYRGLKNLMKYDLVTQFIKNDLKKDVKDFLKCDDTKAINCYVFVTKVEPFIKNGKTTEHSQTVHVDKKDKICNILKNLLQKGESYLRHRSHVNNISEVFPLIRETFTEKCIELDFSENLVLKPKFEVQDNYFSGIQFSRHCTIVEPGENKYVYHLSFDTNYDPVFVHEVLKNRLLIYGGKVLLELFPHKEMRDQYGKNF